METRCEKTIKLAFCKPGRAVKRKAACPSLDIRQRVKYDLDLQIESIEAETAHLLEIEVFDTSQRVSNDAKPRPTSQPDRVIACRKQILYTRRSSSTKSLKESMRPPRPASQTPVCSRRQRSPPPGGLPSCHPRYHKLVLSKQWVRVVAPLCALLRPSHPRTV